MALTAGARLGPYEIASQLGAGGMGEVYRARDSRLQRDVALKILPDLFANDSERIARFNREAQTLAALNHPHIAQIYGVEEASGVRALVMELVDGETLAARLAHGALPTDEALAIARQIADALEAAHDAGVVHRDLKPANIQVRADGTVKVLDFGLAKALEPPPGSAPVTTSPTITTPAMTHAGMVLGTAAYMSPEQAKGRGADRRSDVWAFGCVLYEMLTGTRAFEGEDVSDTLAAVLRGTPEWSRLPRDLSPQITTLLKRCLERDRKARIPNAATIQFLLEEAGTARDREAPPAPSRAGSRSTLVWKAAAVLLALTSAAAAAAWYRARTIEPPVVRFFIAPPDKMLFASSVGTGATGVLSPDGSKLAFAARDATGRSLLFIRSLDALTAQPVNGTDGAVWPFWSPDSRFVAYFSRGSLLKVAMSGGPPQTIVTNRIGNRGGTWSRDGVIVFNGGPGEPLQRVAASGGEAVAYGPMPAGHTGQVFPSFLPDGRHVLYHGYATAGQAAGVYVSRIDGSGVKHLVAADSSGVYDARSGHLLFVRQGVLLAQSFNADTLELRDEPFPVAEKIEQTIIPGAVTFSVSNTGILAYGIAAGGETGQQMVWVDRRGIVTGTAGPEAHYRGIDVATDGTRIAAHRHDNTGGDIWITDTTRGTTSRLTFDPSLEHISPIWSPDGQDIVFSSRRDGRWGLYKKRSDNSGGEEKLIEVTPVMQPVSWSPDGKTIVYGVIGAQGSPDLWALPLGPDRKPFPLAQSPFAETTGQVSPDGKWLAFMSSEGGRPEVWVRPFPAGEAKSQISVNGASHPRWNPKGGELFFLSQASGGQLMSVEVKTAGNAVVAGTPRPLFEAGYVNFGHTGSGGYHAYAVSADGEKFLIPRQSGGGDAVAPAPIAVVINWTRGVTR